MMADRIRMSDMLVIITASDYRLSAHKTHSHDPELNPDNGVQILKIQDKPHFIIFFLVIEILQL